MAASAGRCCIFENLPESNSMNDFDFNLNSPLSLQGRQRREAILRRALQEAVSRSRRRSTRRALATMALLAICIIAIVHFRPAATAPIAHQNDLPLPKHVTFTPIATPV